MRFALHCVCAFACFCIGAYGQILLKGSVVDATSTPVGAARVYLSDHTLAAPVQTFTDPGGAFTLTVPAPGKYDVVAEKEDFFPAKVAQVQLASGTTELTLVLQPVRIVNDSIEVAATPTALDLGTTATRRSLSGQAIMNIPYPNSNDLRNALRAVPGIVRDSRGGIHVNGAAEEQVLFTLNGFNVNDPLTGRFESRLSVESVQAVEINSGNIPSEFGKGAGGALAIRSQTGDDRLRYSATNFVPGFENRKGWIIGDWTPRFGVTGPLRRGKAWFANSSDIQYVQTVVRELAKGEDRTASLRFSNLSTAQVNLSPGHILQGGLLVNGWNAARTGLTAIDPVETTIDRRTRQFFVYVKDQIYLRRGALLEFGYAANRTRGREIPQGDGILAYTPQGKRGNYFADGARRSSRDQLLANAFLPSFRWMGSHQIKTGLDLDHLVYTQDVRRSGYDNYSESGVLTRRTVFVGSGAARKTNEEVSLYVQDSWRPRERLLIETGLRQDWDRLVGRWNFSPRLGVSWSPRTLESTKIYGGVARVFDATALRLFSRPDDQFLLTSYYTDGRLASGPALSLFTIGPRTLDRPRSLNYTLGAAHALANGFSLRADYLRRRGARAFTFRNQLLDGGEPAVPWLAEVGAARLDAIYSLGNERRDAFDSISMTVRHVIRREYEWMASYTRSRALSNAVVDVTQDEPTVVTDNAGPMPWDAPHRFVGWAYLPLPRKNWAIAGFLDTRSGFPYSIQNEAGGIVGQVNAYRFPRFFEMNLHLERRFAMRGHRWALRFGANNLTDRINPDSVNPFVRPGQTVRFYGGNGRSFNVRIRWLGRAL